MDRLATLTGNRCEACSLAYRSESSAQLKDAFGEFRKAAPRLARWWLVIAAGVFPIGLLYGFSQAEALAVAISMIPLGISMIGGMWLHPVWGGAIPTRTRLAVGFGWLLVLFVPAAGLSALSLLMAKHLLGVGD